MRKSSTKWVIWSIQWPNNSIVEWVEIFVDALRFTFVIIKVHVYPLFTHGVCVRHSDAAQKPTKLAILFTAVHSESAPEPAPKRARVNVHSTSCSVELN